MGKAKAPAPAPVYVVRNPRGIPAGRHILQNSDRSRTWFEGDVFDGEPAAWLIERGFLEEVRSDG